MESKKIKGSSAAFALAAVTVMALALAGNPGGDAVGSELSFRNRISVEVIHVDGSREPTEYTWNTITLKGLNHTRSALSGLTQAINSGTNNWTVIELSTSGTAPSSGDSSCPSPVTGSGLDLKRGTAVTQNTGNYTVTATFSPTGSVTGIQKICLSNNTASGSTDLMGSALISSTNVQSGDTLIVNYSVAVG